MNDIFLTNFSEESLGQDIFLADIEFGGDMEAGSDLDVVVQTGQDNLKSAIIRRILTPKGFISTYVYDVTGLSITDQEYGNGAYKYLSEPLSEVMIANVKAELKSCLAQETRIQIQNITAAIVPYQNTFQTSYTIEYIVTGSFDMEVLSLIQDGNSIKVQ